jgi:hypothetical protein
VKRVYLVWRLWEEDCDDDTLEGIYIDRDSAEYAVNERWNLYRIEGRFVRAQDRRL